MPLPAITKLESDGSKDGESREDSDVVVIPEVA